MDHDEFRAAWLDALKGAGLLAYPDRPEDLIELRSMSRKHSVRIGLNRSRTGGPLFASMLLGWTWTPMHSARTYTNEDDFLTELLGRDHAQDVIVESPWLRVDIQLCATAPYAEPIRLHDTTRLRRWTTEVPRMLRPHLREKVERSSRGIEAIHGWVGEPEARVQCDAAGELHLLGVELEAWRSVQLPQASERAVEVFDDETSTQLARLAADTCAAIAAWTKSLAILL
ncbi:MAG TPA: hypothetical protein VFN67_13410 [Polyangiales bacterium]|nr:hypothetical protein [Polyangiales bacterium]